jgi:hypothetical protein
MVRIIAEAAVSGLGSVGALRAAEIARAVH